MALSCYGCGEQPVPLGQSEGCGSSYSSLWTNDLGRHMSEPCRFYCNEPDFKSWRRRAEEIGGILQNRLKTARSGATKLGATSTVLTLLLAGDTVLTEISRLDSAWFSLTTDESTGQALRLIREASCVAEQLDAVITKSRPRIPAVIPSTPGETPSWVAPAGIGLGVVVLAIAALYILGNKRG